MRGRSWVRALHSAALLSLCSRAVLAASDDELTKAGIQVVTEAEAGLVELATVVGSRPPARPEERLAAGDMYLRNRDFARAIVSFEQVVELFRQGKANQASHADALNSLGEAYFRTEQLLSARRVFHELAELATKESYAEYGGRALGRLVDVALRTGRLEQLDFVFERISALAKDDESGALAYARAKANFARRNYPEAERAVQQLPEASPLQAQAGYLLGVIYLNQTLAGDVASAEDKAKVPEKSQRFAKPILQFQKVTRISAKTDEQKHVLDLAWMAIGRIFYEAGSELDAVDAYNHVGRKSPEFATMLYELGWVYVRLGDFKRARRALDLLSVVSPETLHFTDGSLLRADLMLRSKDYDSALRVYQSVKSRFAPILSDVSHVLETVKDPAVYYDQLVQEKMGVRTEHDLPPVVMDWVREESEDDRVFALIQDVSRSRDMVREARRMASRMNTVLESSARAKAFPDIKHRMQLSLGYLNALSTVKKDILKELLERRGESSSKHQELLKRVGELPVTAGDFSRRETSGQDQWNHLSQRLQELRLEADKLQAVVNGLKRVLREPQRFGVGQAADIRERFQTEVDANERDLEGYRKHISDCREAVERGRVQIGFGDSRFVADRDARHEMDAAWNEEVRAARAGQSGDADRALIQSLAPLLVRLDKTEARLRGVLAAYDADVGEKAKELSDAISREVEMVAKQADQLDALDQNARLLVGEVAMRNFGLVRERLKSIVLRADVGVVQQAWEVREQSLGQVQELQKRRAREEQALTEELQEVLQDAGDEL